MVNANIPDIAIEPDKSVKKVSSIEHKKFLGLCKKNTS